MREFSTQLRRMRSRNMRFRRTVTLVGALTAATPTMSAAPDTGRAGAIGLLLLVGLILICIVTGLIGYAVGHATRYSPLFALGGALIPIAAIVVYFWIEKLAKTD